MNDFSEIENELKKLRPIEPSAELFIRIEADLRTPSGEEKIVRPGRFQINWLALGGGLAAAAVLLLFVQVMRHRAPQQPPKIATTSPTQQAHRHGQVMSPETRSTITTPQFVPAGATQVVYRTQDEGLLFPSGSDQPVRRMRARVRETLQWQNPNTGASLRVSYPAEEVTLLPVYGQ